MIYGLFYQEPAGWLSLSSIYQGYKIQLNMTSFTSKDLTLPL